MSIEPAPVTAKANESKAVVDTPKPAVVEPNSASTATPEDAAKSNEPSPHQAAPSDIIPATAPKDPTVHEKKTVDFVEVKGAMENIFAELPSIIKDANHGEMWGVELKGSDDVPTTIVIEKFLRANSRNVAEAIIQLKKALKWRREIDPIKLLKEMEFDSAKFGALGYVTVYPQEGEKVKEVVTWNIYGAVKDNKATFGDVEEFIKWRAALMELSVQKLDLKSATAKIPEDGVDPYRMVQVHDYLNVSFLRMDPAVKAASKKTIETFSMAYPELLKEKFFVNVPLVMGWMFAGMKLFMSAETVKKFHPLSYGSSLAAELPTFGKDLPTAYGGSGKEIKEGFTVKYAAGDEAPRSSDT